MTWAKFNLAWFEALGRSGDKLLARAGNKKMLVVTYNCLLKDTEGQLRRILKFLLAKEKAESIDLTCVMNHVEGKFKRKKMAEEINVYDAELTELLQKTMEMVYRAMELQMPPHEDCQS